MHDQRTRERLLAKIDVREPGECWPWLAFCSSNGYGQFWLAGAMPRAHRVMYEVSVGPIPTGLELDHLCRNKACCNPAHLEPVTRRENARRGIKGVLTTHCPRGHEYVPENTWRHPRLGWRQCKACNRERAQQRRSSKR